VKRLKAGPELKLPDLRNLKVPAFLEDLYYDLKDRRLLPLVALAIVATVAVPFLLAGGSEEPAAKAAPQAGGASASGARASLTVVRANPGLRDYRKRLRHREPTDPSKQRFTAPDFTGARLGAAGDNAFEAPPPTSTTTSSSSLTEITATETGTTTTTTESENGIVTSETETHNPQVTQIPSPPPDGEEEGEGTDSEPSSLAYTIDVRIKATKAATAVDGVEQSTETTTKSRTTTQPEVVAPAPLPGEKAQVVTYMGVNPKTGEPLLLVSDEVTAVFGEGKCLSGVQSCLLLEVELGMPVTFVYGPAGDRYKLTVLKVEPLGAAEP